MTIPTLQEEKALFDIGYKNIAGIDEVGRGALAGPVIAAAVIMARNFNYSRLKKVRDSKELSMTMREKLFTIIKQEAASIGIGIIDHTIIDDVNILNATKFAMTQAIESLNPIPDYLLIDGLILPKLKMKQKKIIKGDKLCFSISCASIIAKVTRDRMMIELDEKYPQYGFKSNKGYGTRTHLNGLFEFGPCSIHRLSFEPLRQIRRLI